MLFTPGRSSLIYALAMATSAQAAPPPRQAFTSPGLPPLDIALQDLQAASASHSSGIASPSHQLGYPGSITQSPVAIPESHWSHMDFESDFHPHALASWEMPSPSRGAHYDRVASEHLSSPSTFVADRHVSQSSDHRRGAYDDIDDLLWPPEHFEHLPHDVAHPWLHSPPSTPGAPLPAGSLGRSSTSVPHGVPILGSSGVQEKHTESPASSSAQVSEGALGIASPLVSPRRSRPLDPSLLPPHTATLPAAGARVAANSDALPRPSLTHADQLTLAGAPRLRQRRQPGEEISYHAQQQRMYQARRQGASPESLEEMRRVLHERLKQMPLHERPKYNYIKPSSYHVHALSTLVNQRRNPQAQQHLKALDAVILERTRAEGLSQIPKSEWHLRCLRAESRARAKSAGNSLETSECGGAQSIPKERTLDSEAPIGPVSQAPQPKRLRGAGHTISNYLRMKVRLKKAGQDTSHVEAQIAQLAKEKGIPVPRNRWTYTTTTRERVEPLNQKLSELSILALFRKKHQVLSLGQDASAVQAELDARAKAEGIGHPSNAAQYYQRRKRVRAQEKSGGIKKKKKKQLTSAAAT